MSQKSPAQSELDLLMQNVFAPLLKSNGFAKSARTWNKRETDVVKVVNVQCSQYSDQYNVSFTVNLGVHHPAFHSLRYQMTTGKRITQTDCDIRTRLGQLVDSRDMWWTVAANSDNRKITEELRQHLNQFAIPWLNSFSNLSNMFDSFAYNKQHFDAAIAGHLLEKESVPLHIAHALQTTNPHFRRTVEAWAENNGYPTATLPHVVKDKLNSPPVVSHETPKAPTPSTGKPWWKLW